ncbi:MAG: AsmA family protein [Alphaproteobacteria bacterium]
MRKAILIGLGVIVGLLVVGVALLVFFFPKDAAMAEATRRIDAATGRHLTVAGEVKVTFWPSIGFSAERASLSNPDGFNQQQPFLAADKIVFAVNVLPLLHGEVQVKQLLLDGVALNLEAKRDGSANWVFPTEENAPQQQNTMEDLHFDDVRLTNSRVSFDAGDGTPPSVLDHLDASLSLKSLKTPGSMHAEFDYRGQRVKVDGTLGMPRAVLDKHETPISVQIASAPLNASLTGTFNAGNGALSGQIDAGGASARQLLAWVGSPLPPGGGFGAFHVSAQMTHQDLTTSLKQAALKLDSIDAHGNLDLVTDAKGRMTVTGALSAPLIDTNVYLPAPPAAATAQGGAGGVNASTAWNNDPIDLSGLKAMDADLTLAAGALKFQRMTFQNVAMTLHVARGAADARLTRIALYGGTGTARMIADGSSATPRIALELNAQNVQALPLLTDAIGLDRIEGRGQLSASLAGTGRSQAAIMHSLNGNTAFTFNDGAWRGVNLANIARTIQSALTGAQNGGGASTDFAELGAHFTLANGVAATQDLHLLNPFVRLDGTGVVDVGAQTIDMRLAPRAVRSIQGQGGNAALQGIGIPFRISGPWTHVSFAPALGDAVQNELRSRAASILQHQGGSSPLGSLGASLFGTPANQQSTSTTTTTTTAQQNSQQQQQQRTPEQQARDALGNLFGHH